MSENENNSLIRLSLRKRQIVEQVGRDRLSTNEVIRQRFFVDCHPTTVTRATSELCASDWLNAYPLDYPKIYFLPGKRAASAFGMTPSATLPLGPQALPTEYAVLLYTSNNHPQVRRLLTTELQALHPWFETKWLLATHALRDDAPRSITELLRVDLGGPADLIARKCLSDIHARYVRDEFRQLVANQEFQLVVITGTTEKAAQINAALSANTWPKGMLFRIAVFTELLSLLPRSY